MGARFYYIVYYIADYIEVIRLISYSSFLSLLSFVKKKKKKIWNDDYVHFGFTCMGNDELQKPQCILCDAIFSNTNMKPSKLQEHFNNKHGVGGVEGHDFEN